MKKTLFAALLASMLPLPSSLADHLIYLGTENARQISAAYTGNLPSRIFLAFDRTNSQLGAVLFFGAGSGRRYIVLPIEDVVTAVIENRAKPGQTITAFGYAEKTEFNPAILLSASLLKGVNRSVDIGGAAGVESVPTVISGTGFLLDTGDAQLVPQVENIKTLARLQLDFTQSSNNANAGAGEPLTSEDPANPGVIQRIVRALESQGYKSFE